MATKTNTEINGNKYYKIKRKVGEEYVDGEKKSVYKYFYGTSKANAMNKYNEFLKEQARLKYEKETMYVSCTLHMRAEDYITNNLEPAAKYSTGTKVRYKSSYNRHINLIRKSCLKSNIELVSLSHDSSSHTIIDSLFLVSFFLGRSTAAITSVAYSFLAIHL